MENKKKYIIPFVILIIYFILMLCLWFFMEKSKGKDYYLIINPNTIIKHEEGEFKQVTSTNVVENESFQVYINQEKVGNYKMRNFKNNWYYIEDNNVNHRINESFFATSNQKISLLSFEKEELNNEDYEKISSMLSELDIPNNRENTFGEKIIIDLDSDNVQETIYAVNYKYKKDNEESEINLVILNKNGKLSVIDKKNMDKNVPVFDCTKKVDTLIDINNDQKYEIITSCMYFDRIGTCHDLYQLKKGKYEKIYKCDDPKSGM